MYVLCIVRLYPTVFFSITQTITLRIIISEFEIEALYRYVAESVLFHMAFLSRKFH